MENWVVAFATIVLAVLTAALAFYTRVMANETRKTREQTIAPNIVVTIEPYERASFYAFLVIENVGSGIAYDVSIAEKGENTFNDEKQEFKLNNLRFMKQKILKSGQRIEHLLGTFESLPVKTYDFDIKARDCTGKEVRFSNTVDVNCNYDRKSFQAKGIEDLVRSFEKFQNDFGHVTTGFRRLKVDTYDSVNRDNERKQMEELRNEHKQKIANDGQG